MVVVEELRLKYAKNYESGRKNLLLMAVLTLVNVVLGYLKVDISFPFSSFAPQLFAIIGSGVAAELGASVFAVVGILFSLVVIGVYALCWALAKKRVGALIAALVIFSLDTLLLLFFIDFDPTYLVSTVIDLLFHAWVLYYLILGISSYYKLLRLPPEPQPAPEVPEAYAPGTYFPGTPYANDAGYPAAEPPAQADAALSAGEPDGQTDGGQDGETL